MALINSISLLMFKIKIKISPTILPVSFAEHLEILKKIRFTCINTNNIDVTRVTFNGENWIALRSI